MIDKQFKNLEEQIEILKYKGMTITDEKYTKKILLRTIHAKSLFIY